jgi:mRNA interferase YafQ
MTRTIERSSAFKKDFRKYCSIESALIDVLYKLMNDEVLPKKYKDHALVGNWSGYRECHIKPDLLLIYSLKNNDTLELVRLGSHSELF